MRGLTPREKAFVTHYLLSANARQSACRAGYSPHSASVTGHRLLVKPKIIAYLKLQREQSMTDGSITKASVLTVLSDMVKNDKIGVEQKLKALDQINKIQGFYSRDLDLLLSMDESTIKELIERTKLAINTTYEPIGEGEANASGNSGVKALGSIHSNGGETISPGKGDQ
jgi:phage terminase small subunit